MGRSTMRLESTSPPAWTCCVSTCAASPTTSSFSLTCPTSRSISTRALRFTSSMMPSWKNFPLRRRGQPGDQDRLWRNAGEGDERVAQYRNVAADGAEAAKDDIRGVIGGDAFNHADRRGRVVQRQTDQIHRVLRHDIGREVG